MLPKYKTLTVTVLLIAILIVLMSGYYLTPGKTDPAALLDRIDEIVRKEFKAELSDFEYPPDCVVIRVFKQEKECEIWAKSPQQYTLNLIMTLPICAMDFEPGPKLKRGDDKTPEGFYVGNFAYHSKLWFMWMDIEDISARGRVKKGDGFRVCLNYPNYVDHRNSRSAGYGNKTGGGICVHGNCISAGCISFENLNFLPVYAFSRHHNRDKYGRIQYHIFPFRFDKTDSDMRKKLAERYTHADKIDRAYLLNFWRNLEYGYNLFEERKKPLYIDSYTDYYNLKDRAENISVIKKHLAETGYYKGEINDEFGENLESALNKYQIDHNLTSDGKIGKKTIAEMVKEGMAKVQVFYVFR